LAAEDQTLHRENQIFGLSKKFRKKQTLCESKSSSSSSSSKILFVKLVWAGFSETCHSGNTPPFNLKNSWIFEPAIFSQLKIAGFRIISSYNDC